MRRVQNIYYMRSLSKTRLKKACCKTTVQLVKFVNITLLTFKIGLKFS